MIKNDTIKVEGEVIADEKSAAKVTTSAVAYDAENSNAFAAIMISFFLAVACSGFGAVIGIPLSIYGIAKSNDAKFLGYISLLLHLLILFLGVAFCFIYFIAIAASV